MYTIALSGTAAKLQASKAEAAAEHAAQIAVVGSSQQTGAPPSTGGKSGEGDEGSGVTTAAAAAASAAKAASAAGAAVFDMQSGAFAAVCTRNPFLLHVFLRIASFAVEECAQQRMLLLLKQVRCAI